MAAQLYSNTKLAECLYEVLSEMVQAGEVQESLAAACLAQVRAQGALLAAVLQAAMGGRLLAASGAAP